VHGVGQDVRRIIGETRIFNHLLNSTVKARAVTFFQLSTWNSIGWILRMQVERYPFNPSAEPALKPRRSLQSDVAEGSYVVRPDQ
jgi:hypothetical protein